ncbi:hypothetical protein HG531_007097 [Fusarium graminearum]|nr:hypothetical protein HG531_007097 [Fusarium graminearum]
MRPPATQVSASLDQKPVIPIAPQRTAAMAIEGIIMLRRPVRERSQNPMALPNIPATTPAAMNTSDGVLAIPILRRNRFALERSSIPKSGGKMEARPTIKVLRKFVPWRQDHALLLSGSDKMRWTLWHEDREDKRSEGEDPLRSKRSKIS